MRENLDLSIAFFKVDDYKLYFLIAEKYLIYDPRDQALGHGPHADPFNLERRQRRNRERVKKGRDKEIGSRRLEGI